MRRHTTIPYLCGLVVSGWLLGSSAWLGAYEMQATTGFDYEAQQLLPLAVVTWSESEVSFAPLQAGVHVRLRVTGPDYVYEEQSEGEGLVFQALEDDGGMLPDGVYRYELLELQQLDVAQEAALAKSESTETAQALKRQWRRQGTWPPPHPRVQQAVFHIIHGQIRAPK